jgi:hypothetical protein
MIELVVDVAGDDLEIVDASADKKLAHQRNVLAHDLWRPASFAITDRAVIGRKLKQRAGASKVEAARHAIGLSRRHNVLERFQFDGLDFRHLIFAITPRFGAITASFRQRAQLRLDCRKRARRVDPFEIRQLIAKPGGLALGVLAGVALGFQHRLFERDFAI